MEITDKKEQLAIIDKLNPKGANIVSFTVLQSLDEFLYFEFTELLKQGLQVCKCRNCVTKQRKPRLVRSYNDKVKHKWTKKFISFLCQIVAVTVLIMVISIVWNGMYLLGIPSIEDVQKVTISYPELTVESKQITDLDNMELAVKLTGFLKYSLWEKADSSDDPLITITYYLNSGSLNQREWTVY